MSADNWTTCPQCRRADSLREDYEIGIHNGRFEIGYYAKCYYDNANGCGFSFAYKYSEIPATQVPFADQAP